MQTNPVAMSQLGMKSQTRAAIRQISVDPSRQSGLFASFADDVLLSFTPPPDGDVKFYCAYRDGALINSPNIGNGPGCTNNFPSTAAMVDSDVPAGPHVYRVEATTRDGNTGNRSIPLPFTVASPSGGPISISPNMASYRSRWRRSAA